MRKSSPRDAFDQHFAVVGVQVGGLQRYNRTVYTVRFRGSHVRDRLRINQLWRLISREGRAGTQMIRMSAARQGSANSAPRLHRDGRTAYTQRQRRVT
jgi:hypothetical protein